MLCILHIFISFKKLLVNWFKNTTYNRARNWCSQRLYTSVHRNNVVASNLNHNLILSDWILTNIDMPLFYLGMQLDGVLSTSQAAKSFMGTGFDVLVIFSDLFFSVILNQHQYTTGYNFHSTARTTVFNLHCYLITKHNTVIIFILPQYKKGTDTDTNTTILSTLSYCAGIIGLSDSATDKSGVRRSIHLTAARLVLPCVAKLATIIVVYNSFSEFFCVFIIYIFLLNHHIKMIIVNDYY